MYAVIYLPNFSLQAALRHEPELFSRPVALNASWDYAGCEVGQSPSTGKVRQAQPLAAGGGARMTLTGEGASTTSGKVFSASSKTVFQITQAARETGVCEGLTSTQALARCPNLIFKNRSVAQDNATTEIFLQCAYSFSPNIEATAPGICTLDLKGLSVAAVCGRRSNSETTNATVTDAPLQEWAEKIITQLASLNLRGQIGIAENPDLALHAAKIAKSFFLVENSKEFISRLPIESIEPTPDILNVLHRWGIRTLGDFIALGKDKLAERLGPDALELFDRASANEVLPLDLVQPKDVFEEAVEFEKEIETLQPLLFILRRFIEQLSHRLEMFYFVAEEIQLRLTLSSGEKLERNFCVPSPTRNIETLFRMLQTHLETVQTESPIIALQLAAKPAKPEHFQFGLFETALRDPNHFYEMLAQLTSLLGSERVGTPVVENSFRPDAFRMEPANFEAAKVLPTSCRQNRNPDTNTSTYSSALSADRMSAALSLRRFRPPLAAIIQMREGKPALLNSEKFVGAIANANGPFRSSGNWWEPKQLWSRDEWDIETSNGELFRIFTQNGNWFLEGEFD